MSTIADKLTSIIDTKALLKAAIERKGVTIAEGTPFASYPSAIDSINVVAPDVPSNTWKVDSTWWDIETVIKNDDQTGHNGSYIVLISDTETTTSLNGANAYRTSDGAYYTSDIAHTWDTTKDKESAGAMKTRYIIYYFDNFYCDAASHVLRRQGDNGWEPPCPAYCLGVVFKCHYVNGGGNRYYDNTYKGYVRGAYFTTNMCKATFIKMLEGYNFYGYSQSLSYYTKGATNYIKDFPSILPIVLLHNVYPAIYDNNAIYASYEANSSDITSIRNGCFEEYKYILPTTSGGSDVTMPLYPTGFKKIRIIGTLVTKPYSYKAYTSITKPSSINENLLLENIVIEGEQLWWTSCDISYFWRLSRQGIMNLINAFQDRTGAGTATLTISTMQNNKLTTEDKAILANKNWTLNIVSVSV